MNILIEGGNLNSIAEGTRNIAISYAQKLKEQGHNVSILTKQFDRVRHEKYKKIEIVDGIKFYRWFNYCDKFYKYLEGGKANKTRRLIYNFLALTNYLEFYLTYRKILKHENIDVTQIFLKGLRPRFHYKLLKLFNKSSLILTLLGDPSFNYIKYNPKKTFEGTDLILVTSKTIFSHLESLGVKNLKYLSYGINTKRFKPLKKKGKKKIFFSRYYTYFPEVLEAIKKITKEYKVELIFHEQAKEDVKKAKLKNVRYIGFLKNIEELYGVVDIVVDLHKEEKYLTCASPPAKILESMSSGTRVISTDLPEIREIIQDNKTGFLVKKNSSEEIYKKLKEALNSKKNIGKNAREFILKNFNLEKSIIEYEEIYRKIRK